MLGQTRHIPDSRHRKGVSKLSSSPMKKLAVFLAAIVLSGVACSGDDALNDMELRSDLGVVNVIRDGETINVDGRVELMPGDVIVTKEDALAKFALEGGSEARQGEIQGNARLLVTSTTSLEAQEGEVLLQVAEPTRVEVDGVTARSSDADFRIDRRFGSVRAAVYTGSVELDAPGEANVALSTLYQATIVAGDLPNQTRPYQLDVEDPWDQVLLEEVVNLEQELAVLARGLTSQLGRGRPDLTYFRALADGGNVGFISDYLRRRTSDLLIGFTIARNADGSLQSAFREAFDYFDQGARWGVAAKIMEVEPRPIVAQLERLILGTGVVAANGSGNTAEFTVAAADAAETGGAVAPPPNGSTDPQDSDPQEPNDPQDPQEPNDPEDPPEDPDECTNSIECAGEDLEDQLPGGGDPSPSPTNEQEEQGSRGGGLLDGGLD